jgi:cell division protein ZapB
MVSMHQRETAQVTVDFARATHYSVPMESEISSLEGKINQLVQLCQRLRKDNNDLRQELAASQSDNKQLSEKISNAKERLETILSRIPEDE